MPGSHQARGDILLVFLARNAKKATTGLPPTFARKRNGNFLPRHSDDLVGLHNFGPKLAIRLFPNFDPEND